MTDQIRLLLADVDGTLVTSAKTLTERTRRAVHELRGAGVELAITTGRPPRGVRMLIEPLGLTTPIAAFNGGLIVDPQLRPIRSWSLPPDVAAEVIELIEHHGLDVWVYSDSEWVVRNPDSPRVRIESATVQFTPKVAPNLDEVVTRAVKIVGTSEDHQAVLRCEADARRRCGHHISLGRSQPYYLDVTHPRANKGAALLELSELLHVPTASIATVGDMPTDVLMFARSGLSVAMGNASADVQRCARHVTTSNDDEGFAHAVEWYLLGKPLQNQPSLARPTQGPTPWQHS